MTRARFRARRSKVCGQVAEWLKAADCKSALARVRWFESSPVHHSDAFQRSSGALKPSEPLVYLALPRASPYLAIPPHPAYLVGNYVGNRKWAS